MKEIQSPAVFPQAVCRVAVNLVFPNFSRFCHTNIIYCCYLATMAFGGEVLYKMETALCLVYLRLTTLVHAHKSFNLVFSKLKKKTKKNKMMMK